MGKRGRRSEASLNLRELEKFILEQPSIDTVEDIILKGLGEDFVDLIARQQEGTGRVPQTERKGRLDLCRLVGTLCSEEQVQDLLTLIRGLKEEEKK